MQPTRLRFKIRNLIIGVAMVALNLAGALAITRPKGDRGGEMGWAGNIYLHFDQRAEYGVGCYYRGPIRQTNGRAGARLSEVCRVPPQPTLLQVWFPVIASSSVTLLLLAVWPWSSGTFHARSPNDGDDELNSLLPPMGFSARWMMIVTALITLNLACASYRPTFDLYMHDSRHPPGDLHARWQGTINGVGHGYVLQFVGSSETNPPKYTVQPGRFARVCNWLNFRDLFSDIPRVLNVQIDGSTVERCAVETEGSKQKRLPAVIFQESPVGEATIDFRADGGIVGYAGRPGQMLSRPLFVRSPSFSFLEMHWPLIASVTITSVILAVALRRVSLPQIRAICLALTLAGTNMIAFSVSYRTREQPRLLSETWGFAGEGEQYFSDGGRRFYVGGIGGPRRVTRIERPSPPPTLLQTWWPVLASASITGLVVVLSRRRPRPSRADPLTGSERFPDHSTGGIPSRLMYGLIGLLILSGNHIPRNGSIEAPSEDR